MIETVRLLDDSSQRMLRSFIGWTLESYEAYIMFDNPDQVYKTVRLDFGGAGFLIQNKHESIPIGPGGDMEEISILSIEPDDGRELWCPSSKTITRKTGVELTVDDIYLVVDTPELTKGDIPVNKLKLIQAIVFRQGGRLFAIDRDIWFDEYLTIREGADIDALVRDAAGDWHEEPPYDYHFTRDIISLAMGGIRV